jgi:hypothetical protein
VLVTREFNPGETGSQLKYFALGVGNIRVGWLGKDPDKEVLVLTKLVHLTRGGAGAGAGRSAEARQACVHHAPRHLRQDAAGREGFVNSSASYRDVCLPFILPSSRRANL